MAQPQEVTSPLRKKFSEEKDKDEKRFMVMDAVNAFKRLPELKREIIEIRKDKPLLAAVQEALKKEVEDDKAAQKLAK